MLTKLFSVLFKMILYIIAPFILLVRGAVYLHNSSNYLPWICVFGGALMAIAVLFIYLSFIHQLFVKGGQAIKLKTRLIISTAVVLAYITYGVLYMSNGNFKTPELSKEIRKVHPVVRIALSTLTILDKEINITDADRVPEDYQKMGLKSIKHSLHYRQSTGYSHAIDLRTKGRPEWKNQLVALYFKVMGLRTLRHVGTDDHLHISLKSHDHPSAR